MSSISRRSFVKAAAATTAAAAAVGVTSAVADEAVAWADEADILIVGCGGAGIAAAITAADEGLGKAIVFEAAPEEWVGGNTRVSAQVIFCPTSVEGAIKYQTNLNGGNVVEPELVQAWAENITQNIDWLSSQGIVTQQTAFFNPEWPDVDGSEASMCYLVGEEMGFGQLWDALWARGQELGIDVRFDTRIVKLIMENGEVAGVEDEAGNAYKANKGVLLSCGGFENNPEMVQSFYQIGFRDCRPLGTPFNRGDGILMAQSAGAQLWHMNNFANSNYGVQSNPDYPTVIQIQWPKRDFIYVGPDGTRFQYEETNGLARHGKYLISGCATNMTQLSGAWSIFGSDMFDDQTPDGCVFMNEFLCFFNIHHGLNIGTTNQDYLDAGLIYKGETIEELAEQIGIDPATLAATVERYNGFAANNEDPDFHRGTAVYSAFNYGAQGEQAARSAYGDADTTAAGGDDEMTPSIFPFDLKPINGPFYAVRLYTGTLNTQGGPKRAADGGVVSAAGGTIPRLYAAGEMGTIYSYNYNGGGNVSEAMSSGRLAARSIGALEARA